MKLKLLSAAAVSAALVFCPRQTLQAEDVQLQAKEATPDAGAAEIKVSTAAPEILLTRDNVIKKLREWDKNLESLTCGFSQEITFGEAGITNKITGKIHYLRPNKLRIEHISPQKQIVYTDKKTIWIYKPQDKQAVKTLWDGWIKQQSAAFSGITDFGSYALIIDKHDITVSESKTAGLIDVRFAPRQNPKLYTLTLSLSRRDFFPVSIKLSVGKTDAVTKLENIEKNGKIPEELFDFKPAKEISIIEL